MNFEQYDPEKHDLKQYSGYDSAWEKRFEAAVSGPIVIRDATRSSVAGMAKARGYKVRTRSLAEGTGFVLWAEKLP